MEELQWESLDTEMIKSKYEEEQQQLKAALLHGVPWEDVKEKQHAVTQLSILLYRRFSQHPAEDANRCS